MKLLLLLLKRRWTRPLLMKRLLLQQLLLIHLLLPLLLRPLLMEKHQPIMRLLQRLLQHSIQMTR